MARPALYSLDVHPAIFFPIPEKGGNSETLYHSLDYFIVHAGNAAIFNWKKKSLLSKSARSEEFSDEIEGPVVGINPRSIETDDGVMIKGTKQMDFRVKAFQRFWRT